MAYFDVDPMIIQASTMPTPAPVPAALPPEPVAPAVPPPPQVPPAPVFVPVPMIQAKPQREDKMKITPAIARRAQGIYPREEQQKQQMVDNAKMPTPTGAWGAPE